MVNIDQYFEQMNQGEVIIAYKGSIGTDIIAQTLNLVETKIEETIERNAVRKKLYNVLVESLQNLFHHVESPPALNSGQENIGVFILSRLSNGFRIATGNFIKHNKIPILKEKIDKINSLTPEELKDFYKFVLNNQKFSEKGGGGLGLIDMARKTGNKLDYKFFTFDDEYQFFNLNVFINDTKE